MRNVELCVSCFASGVKGLASRAFRVSRFELRAELFAPSFVLRVLQAQRPQFPASCFAFRFSWFVFRAARCVLCVVVRISGSRASLPHFLFPVSCLMYTVSGPDLVAGALSVASSLLLLLLFLPLRLLLRLRRGPQRREHLVHSPFCHLHPCGSVDFCRVFFFFFFEERKSGWFIFRFSHAGAALRESV